MAIVRFLSSTSSDPAALVRIYNYVTDKIKNPVHAIGSTYFPPDNWLGSVQALKELHGKEGMRQYTHAVVSMSDKDPVRDVGTMNRILDKIIHLFDGVPSLYSVHTNTNHIHAHIVNSATRLDGYQYGMSEAMFNDFMNKAGDILESFGCERPIKENRKEYCGEEDDNMEKYYEVEPKMDEPSEDDYSIATPQTTLTVQGNVNVSHNRHAKVRLVVAEKKDNNELNSHSEFPAFPFRYNPQEVTMEPVTGTIVPEEQTQLPQRNRFYINNSPEIHCNNIDEAQTVLKQMNSMCSQFSKSVVEALNNNYPCDFVLNFDPRLFLGK